MDQTINFYTNVLGLEVLERKAAYRGQPVLGVGRDPQLFAGLGPGDGLTDLDLGAVIQHDPQLGAARVGLQAEALAGLDDHQADGDVLVEAS